MSEPGKKAKQYRFVDFDRAHKLLSSKLSFQGNWGNSGVGYNLDGTIHKPEEMFFQLAMTQHQAIALQCVFEQYPWFRGKAKVVAGIAPDNKGEPPAFFGFSLVDVASSEFENNLPNDIVKQYQEFLKDLRWDPNAKPRTSPGKPATSDEMEAKRVLNTMTPFYWRLQKEEELEKGKPVCFVTSMHPEDAGILEKNLRARGLFEYCGTRIESRTNEKSGVQEAVFYIPKLGAESQKFRQSFPPLAKTEIETAQYDRLTPGDKAAITQKDKNAQWYMKEYFPDTGSAQIRELRELAGEISHPDTGEVLNRKSRRERLEEKRKRESGGDKSRQ